MEKLGEISRKYRFVRIELSRKKQFLSLCSDSYVTDTQGMNKSAYKYHVLICSSVLSYNTPVPDVSQRDEQIKYHVLICSSVVSYSAPVPGSSQRDCKNKIKTKSK